MATWRLRRLYHAEAGYYTYKLNDTTGHAARYNLDHSAHLGLVTDWSQSALTTFNRQESRLERSFYRALHELQRLKSQRQPALALVSPNHQGRVSHPPGNEVNDIQIAIPDPSNPGAEPAIHLVPTT
jgi:hypothetical protein